MPLAGVMVHAGDFPMTEFPDAELYARGVDALVASWEAYALSAPGAAVTRSLGVTVAVFPNGPESIVYNNALLERDLGATARAAALDEMQAAYAAGVGRFAAWVHECDTEMQGDLA